MGGPGSSAFVKGKRFEADISRDRTMSDIRDKKLKGHLILIGRKDMENLHSLLGSLIYHEDPPEEGRFTASLTIDQKMADILDGKLRTSSTGYLMALDYEASAELFFLSEELISMLKE